ncbi:hypothetical protein Barb6XT_02643 [Bacteroidales bacterium Barb6XT]|nr:hypothetical protein Barb6XT_02643 [Bacteroidales bacterium Barb6XT]
MKTKEQNDKVAQAAAGDKQQEANVSKKTIQMGNDEFILYIRKRYKSCCLKNPDLGDRIWRWIEKHAQGEILGNKSEECFWRKQADNIGEILLPYTATQFEFRSNARN